MFGGVTDQTARPAAAFYRRVVLNLVAIAAGGVIAAPCAAQVIEIAPDGEVVTYAGAMTFDGERAQPISLTRETPAPPSVGRIDVSRLIGQAAARHSVSADLITEVAWQESRFRQAAVSPRGASGIMQLTAATARELGVDRQDPAQNVYGGAAYLRRMLDRYGGDVRLALAAYNAGPGAVDRYGGVPPFRETTTYVATILERLARRASVPAATLSPLR